jgi:hypothetical protein
LAEIFMPTVATELPPPVNHVFVDFENVHEIDLAIIGNRAVSFTLLVGARQTKLDVSLVEKLFEHAVSVQLVRLTSAGKNALDFTLAYYVGRAVAADPTGSFHIVSRDAGYDPLVKHLRSRNILAQRHESFITLPFASALKPASPTPPPSSRKPKSPATPKSEATSLNGWETRVLEHFRKPSGTRPRNQKKLVSFLVAYSANRITEAVALRYIDALVQAGHVAIGDKGAVTYHLQPE